MALYLIDPDEKLDFTLDFSDWLDSGVEIVAAPTWTVTPTGPTLSDQSETATAATIFMSGATRGQVYRLSCEAVTDATVAQTIERTITVRCEEK